MRLLNKIAVGASAFAFAAALSAGVNATSADAAVSASFNLDCSEMVVSDSANSRKVVVSFPTEKKGVLSADKNVCTYDGNNVVVDLSTLNVTKDNYIKVSTDKTTTPVVYKIPAAVKLGKGKASATDGAISVTKSDKSAYNNTASLQCATATSSWADYEDMTFKDFLQLGATIRVRVAGKANAGIASTGTIKDKDNEYALNVVGGSLPSKEIKVKIAKMANAPKTKVDYAKRAITIPAKSEYRVNTTNSLGEWVYCADKKVVAFDLYNDGTIDVRTKETERKPASKYAVTSWKAIYQFGVKKDAQNAKKATLVVTQPAVDTVTGGAVEVEATVTSAKLDSKGRVKTATSTAISLKNASKKYSYQIVAVAKSDTVPKFDAKLSGIKTAKVEKSTTVTVKGDEAKDIYVRRVAVKGSEWVTDWVKVMTITDKSGTVTVIDSSASN